MNTISVSELSNYIKTLFDLDDNLSHICVRGELSNYKIHSTGHHYFSLKDENALIDAVCFKGNASKIRFIPKDGMKVILFGSVSSFPKSGRYQIYVSDMQPEGIGALYAAFEELKNKLYAEGLFDESLKKDLPLYPSRIGLVTSATGAAVMDMIRILSARFPLSEVIVCPVSVQGGSAAGEISDMLDYIDKYRLCDLIICGRGGGSVEDLWAFNEEKVARAIVRCGIPVISAVGHEPDVTIADFVADVRASTPSNAAELAVPDASETKAYLISSFSDMLNAEKLIIAEKKQALISLRSKKEVSSPLRQINDKRMTLSLFEQKLSASMNRIYSDNNNRFIKAASTLDALSPLKHLSRGYSVVKRDDIIVKSVIQVKETDELSILVKDGKIKCSVLETEETRNACKQ